MSPWQWWIRRRAEREADREAIAELARAGDEPTKSMGETVMDAAGEFPPPV
jgi:predicted Zn-dependent protease